MENLIIHLSTCGHVSIDDESLTSTTREDILDCASQGDCQEACEYILDNYDVDFHICRIIDGEGSIYSASIAEKSFICRENACDSESDFTDEPTADMYLVWFAAGNLKDDLYEQSK